MEPTKLQPGWRAPGARPWGWAWMQQRAGVDKEMIGGVSGPKAAGGGRAVSAETVVQKRQHAANAWCFQS